MEGQPIPEPGQEAIFKQLDEYEWEKDREFQGGLSAILGPSPSPSQTHELTIRAQCFYFARKKGVVIDFDDYKAYLLSKPSSSPKNASFNSEQASTALPNPAQPLATSQPNTTAPTHSNSEPGFQFHSRTTPLPPSYRTSRDLFSSPAAYPFGASQTPAISKPSTTTATTTTKATSFQPAADPTSAPYPASFPDIVSLIQSGAPIPGIVDVDPTVAWGQGSKPTMKARRKPYEMHLTEDQVQPGYWGGTFGDARDKPTIQQELPDGEEPAFKGANWWKVVEAREKQGTSDAKKVTESIIVEEK